MPTSWTNPIPGTLLGVWASSVNAIFDTAKSGIQALELALGRDLNDDATAIAARLPGIAAMRRLVLKPNANEAGLRIMGNSDPAIVDLMLVEDYGTFTIFGVKNAGGAYVTDWLSVYRSVASPPSWWANIYGYVTVNGRAEFSWPGPPGNLLSYADASQEVFDASRAGTLGTWNIPFGAGQIAVNSEQPFGVITNPVTSYNSIRLTANTSGSLVATTASGTGGIPAVAGQTYSVVGSTNPLDTVRSPQWGLQWYTAGGVFISQGLGAGGAQAGVGTWTKGTSGALVAPATTAFMNPVLNFPTAANLERHKVSSVAVYNSSQTVFAPPFVGQPFATFGTAIAGDTWRRSDTPTVANQRIYVCTTGGLPSAQVWTGIL